MSKAFLMSKTIQSAKILLFTFKVTWSVSHILSLKHEISLSNTEVWFVPHSKHTASPVNLRKE
jgi:hypothetical protein